MKSEKGMSIVRFVAYIVATLLFLGVCVYVIVQDNGIYDREIKPLLENRTSTNEVVEK